MKIVFKDGPKMNVYLAPSGVNYCTERGLPFEVKDERDLAYFLKKSCVEKVGETQPKTVKKVKAPKKESLVSKVKKKVKKTKKSKRE